MLSSIVQHGVFCKQKPVLIGKLIYLRVTGPDITFAIGVLSSFMHRPKEVHWTAALRILSYIKSSPGKNLLYKKHGLFVFLAILTQNMLVTREIGSPLLVIAHSLEEIW